MLPSSALWAAVAAAAASVFFGGMVFCTRFVIDQTEPLTLAFFRFGVGFVCVAPVLARRDRPRVRQTDWGAIAGLGVLLYALMPILVGAGLQFSYASRGALVLASQPLFTLLLAYWRGEERLTPVKLFGIALRHGADWASPSARVSPRPPPASIWAGDALLFCAALCIAVYNVYSQPQLQRYPAPVFTALSMGLGALSLVPFTLGLGPDPGLAGLHPLGLDGCAVYRHVWGRDRLHLMGLGLGPDQSHPGGHLPDAQSSDRHAVGRRFSGRADYPTLRHGPAGRAGRNRSRSLCGARAGRIVASVGSQTPQVQHRSGSSAAWPCRSARSWRMPSNIRSRSSGCSRSWRNS